MVDFSEKSQSFNTEKKLTYVKGKMTLLGQKISENDTSVFRKKKCHFGT